ncbi:MAG: hypothetical protein J6S67_14015 [Methanobrevibacter sp.]|nr:hypothetical protein [Methanobrevibacter sp.]
MQKVLFDEQGAVYNEKGERIGKWFGLVVLDSGEIIPLQTKAYIPIKLGAE